MKKTTLCDLFLTNKTDLEQSLNGMSLPKDLEKTQETIASYMAKVFDADGEFRQNLTQSEDYILEAAISLLNAQQNITSALTKEIPQNEPSKELQENITQENKSEIANSTNSTYSIIGAAGGALAGKLILGGWGAVFGAIAGVAISVYLSNKPQNQTRAKSMSTTRSLPIEEPPKTIDIDRFTNIIYEVCASVDNLIGTFRAQVNRVVQKYESIEKPSLDKEYRPIIESVQSLVGYERNHNVSEEKYTKKLQERIEDLAESLDNYDITLENYSEDKSQWFDKVTSPNTTGLKEVYPAVIKNNSLIIPGKVFIPE